LTKDANQLTVERQRGTQLTIELTKSKEKEEQVTTAFKEMRKEFTTLQTANTNLKTVMKKTEEELKLNKETL